MRRNDLGENELPRTPRTPPAPLAPNLQLETKICL